ncbi:MAG TPA: alkaline phosphatase D family protein, partial [Mycobacteriales bacterium]|nr:alkaline phosphatase D family protein [Mycobacteriales bacterium]
MSTADLVVGPLLRYTDPTTACVWVETSGPAEVGVRGTTAATFEVEGHHYGYVVLEGLAPGTDEPYEVLLDGRRAWPPDDGRPAPRLRTPSGRDRLDVVFGSCRVDRPHERPWTLTVDEHPDGVGVDALHALALALQQDQRELPDLLLLLGDQVYADEGLSPRVRERQVARRGEDSAPVGEVADFEEYTWLYRDSWTHPEVRWLLATVPSAMVFDDHDVRDDWNTSAAWRAQMSEVPWWHERVVGAYMSYWLYQHLGNLRPDRLREQDVLDAVCRDGGTALRRYAELADAEVDGGELVRWSFGRDLGVARLVVVDTRSGRVLGERHRQMLSEDEWDLVDGFLRGDVEHLLVASSLPVVLERSLHDLERWDDAVAGGAWGRRAARLGERVRQALD